MRKKIFAISIISAILTISCVYYFFKKEEMAQAGTEHNVSGWAWSETIGWISFNNTSGGGATSYGVNIDPATGNLSGYAWSENIGWIKFNPAGPYPKAPNYSAKLDPTTNKITGWARACAGTINGDCNSPTRTDGWDGWILLGPINIGGNDYGVYRNVCNLEGYAWGSDVVGWIKFNGTAQDGSSYGVTTTFCGTHIPGSPSVSNPTATINYCNWNASPQVASGTTITFNWIYSDPEHDLQKAFEIWLDNDNTFGGGDPKFKATLQSNGTSYILDLSQNQSTRSDKLQYPLSWSTTYYWKIKVKDINDNWSDWSDTSSFTTAIHSYPHPDFDISPTNPKVNQLVTFTDKSKCYSGGGEYDCKNGSGIVSYWWEFGNGLTSSVKGDATTTYTSTGSKTVKLTIRVTEPSQVFSCDISKSINISIPLPPFIER